MARFDPFNPFFKRCTSIVCFGVGTLCGRCLHAEMGDLEEWTTRMQPIQVRSYSCQYTETAVEVDGRLDDAVWEVASWTEAFVDIEGDLKPEPRFKTQAKLLWDDQFLYIGASLEEPHVWGTLTEHDSVIFHDPDFEVFIDPDGDTHEYFEFEINALNTSWDLHLPKPYKDLGSADNCWGIPGLKTAVFIDGTLNHSKDEDRGWSVEIAIPWEAFRSKAPLVKAPSEGHVWRINFSRVQWQVAVEDGKYTKIPETHEDNWVWSPQGVVDMHRPEMWGQVIFTKASQSNIASDRVEPLAASARKRALLVYYAQRSFFYQHEQWASRLEQLGLDSEWPGEELLKTEDGYQYVVPFGSEDASVNAWHIHQDRLLQLAEPQTICEERFPSYGQ